MTRDCDAFRAREPMRDYEDWHRGYDDPAAGLPWRLRAVQGYLSELFDAREGPLRVVSVCAGDGRDVLGVLAGRTDAHRVRTALIEINPTLAQRAREAAEAAGLSVDVHVADAGSSDTYRDIVPADLLLLVGIFGNIDDADRQRTIAAAPQLCAPGALLAWSRGRAIDGDRNQDVRAEFAAAGFRELRYDTYDSPAGGLPALGLVRYEGAPKPLVAGERWFTFRR